jgi:hypothetical protein
LKGLNQTRMHQPNQKRDNKEVEGIVLEIVKGRVIRILKKMIVLDAQNEIMTDTEAIEGIKKLWNLNPTTRCMA